jgi:hypothetical protein
MFHLRHLSLGQMEFTASAEDHQAICVERKYPVRAERRAMVTCLLLKLADAVCLTDLTLRR